MRIFCCDHCQNPVFFENFQCVKCGRALAYLPEFSEMGSLKPTGDGLWKPDAPGTRGRLFRLCENYARQNVCNWAVANEDAHALCISCRLTDTIPDLTQPGYVESWFALEVAKRRLVYSLLALDLPVVPLSEDSEHGLTFRLLADPDQPTTAAPRILTGHADGVITINLAEADDAEREKRRVAMGEPYRTLLGHFRHEVGHYYWDLLIRDTAWLEEFRTLFGDDRQDYAQALQRHYDQGPPADWQNHFVSAYASTHPWEDWAETWAHYLHISDALETASDCGWMSNSLVPNARPTRPRFTLHEADRASFDQMMTSWFGLMYVINSMNRSLGTKDSYPFVLSAPAVEKLRFVHRVCTEKGPA
jgi:hypothetical protein